MKLLAGNSNLPLARAIADYLELPLTQASVRRFADEEVFVEIHENVRGEDVFVVQSTSFAEIGVRGPGFRSCRA
jgi:ribose-phosphate pyrophosphokinase